ncbi:SIR2 family protein [Deinococcus petrolearius]|uniref:SIR2 family protein n=1 Tax=Deinococcus petrolearius TaxID=1751295 RepID=A0ABW1DNK6_9DEIO
MTLPPHLIELAVSIHHNHGVYALLLGSGMSRAAGIPTAWGIVEDLMRQVAQASGVTPVPEGKALHTWYATTFGVEASYSELITKLEPTSAGQRNLLRSYFEREDEEGQLLPHEPSRAHRAIARLCQAGVVRVIVTTNFDRLAEQALAEVGVIPTVISNELEIEAAPPLVHGGVFVLKLHGDYVKDDVRNSVDDLETYPERLRAYLERVLDEFGLIVCGWSGEWDRALRHSLLQTPNRRYPLVWSAYSEPSAAARELIEARRGRLVARLDADVFFEQLEGRVLALQELRWAPPSDAHVLAAEVKRFMAHPVRDGARLTDLIERVCDDLNTAIRKEAGPPGQSDIKLGLDWVLGVSRPLLHVLGAVLKYDRSGEWTATLKEALTRIDWDVHGLGVPMTDTEQQLRRLPVLLVGLATAGLSAAYGKPEAATFLQADPYREAHATRYSPVEALLRSASLNDQLENVEFTQRAVPIRYWAVDKLVEELAPYFNPATTYEDLRVGELLLALIALDEVVFRRPGKSLMQNTTAVQGTHLYHLSPERARVRLFTLFEPGLKRLPERLGTVAQQPLAAEYDKAAPSAVISRYDYGSGGFRADMSALVSRAFD